MNLYTNSHRSRENIAANAVQKTENEYGDPAHLPTHTHTHTHIASYQISSSFITFRHSLPSEGRLPTSRSA
jgi:hypothetical protein